MFPTAFVALFGSVNDAPIENVSQEICSVTFPNVVDEVVCA